MAEVTARNDEHPAGDPAIRLRPARATVDEGRLYARYVNEVSEGFMSLRLGRRYVEVVAAAFIQPDHDLSYQNVTFVERDGRIVGMTSGFTATQQRRFTEQPLRRAAGGRALRVRITAVLFAPMLRILESVEDGDFYIATMILDDSERGRGVGSMLLDHMQRRAESEACAGIALDVANNNEGARRLYERRGWKAVSRWPTLPLVPPMFHRMVKSV